VLGHIHVNTGTSDTPFNTSKRPQLPRCACRLLWRVSKCQVRTVAAVDVYGMIETTVRPLRQL
jgi:hypothetical protein